MNKFKYAVDGTKKDCPSTIEEVLGIKKSLDLPYSSQAALEEGVKTLNMHDLQALAIRLGIKPCADRPRLVKNITTQYIRLTRTYGSAINENPPEFDPSKF